MVASEMGYTLSVSRVNFYRETLNKGRFEPIGFKQPNPLIQRIINKEVSLSEPPK